ncbi:MAG: light-harvesting protein B-800-850 alpha chain [Rhodobacteraceae bacterium HLUCCO18]|nr:MAG: light-harvesting protein B-800-850 alpha chain [Rhodobacteraceae bacterium HLUCCO18]
MNNAKMWLVVKPTVGIPLFLSAVAVGSFSVHVAVLSNTSWVADFLSGQELGSGDTAARAQEQTILPASAGAADLPMYLEADAAGAESMRVILPDGRTATLVVDDLTSAALVD